MELDKLIFVSLIAFIILVTSLGMLYNLIRLKRKIKKIEKVAKNKTKENQSIEEKFERSSR